jgi:polar amino acid transport system substrate-binding protein
MKRLLLVALVLVIGSMLLAEKITFYTEEYPPYNYKGSQQVEGMAVDLLDAMFKVSGENYTRNDIKVVPWTRGYNLTLRDPNTCLFSMTRTEKREDSFYWVGPITNTTIVLIAKKDRNIKINDVAEIKNYKIAAIKEDIGEQLLLENGIKKSDIDLASNNHSNILKLKKGRVDLWAYEGNVASWQLKQEGENPKDYEKVYTLSSGELYFAFSKQTPKSVIVKYQKALDQLRKTDANGNSQYKEIMSKY